MTHPFLFCQWLVEKLGFGFSHEQLEHYGFFNHVSYTWITMLILVAFGVSVGKRCALVPTAGQSIVEALMEEVGRLADEIMGPKGRPYLPMITTFALFILLSNLIGLVPGFAPPTASLNTNAALALVVFFMTHFVGIKEHGVKYLKHFVGPIWWLSPVILPIEIIGHIARPVSLTLRLFGNMYGHEIVLMIFFGLMPFLVPLPMMLMGALVAFIQTFVFTLLAIIYIAGALEEAH